MAKRKILVIYTGGTIGMVLDPLTGALSPFDFSSMTEAVPSLKKLDIDIDVFCFDELIDSSDMGPTQWQYIASIIDENYYKFDGFVVLHGTDTMAYTASALSFMLQNLQKAVILTGSQLPLGILRSDGKNNLINALEMAAAYDENGKCICPEVSVCFENQLFRGNRISKQSAEYFNAFVSPNYPPLAKVGVKVKWNRGNIRYTPENKKFKLEKGLDSNLIIIKVFPGMHPKSLDAILNIPDLKGVILETYGSGNVPTSAWFCETLQKAIQKGILIMNVSQCLEGRVEMGKYAASLRLKEINIINGFDITTESAVCKMMFLLAQNISTQERLKLLTIPLCGELSTENE